MTVVTGLVVWVHPLSTRLHTLSLKQEQLTGTNRALRHRRAPTVRAGGVTGSASAVAVLVVPSRALRNTFPMMQCCSWGAAGTERFFGETGLAGRITGVADPVSSVVALSALGHAASVLEQL